MVNILIVLQGRAELLRLFPFAPQRYKMIFVQANKFRVKITRKASFCKPFLSAASEWAHDCQVDL